MIGISNMISLPGVIGSSLGIDIGRSMEVKSDLCGSLADATICGWCGSY